MCGKLKCLVGRVFGQEEGERQPALPHREEIGSLVQKTAAGRLKLWELEERYHCPVVGTCLTLGEIKKISRKGGFAGRNFDDYRQHVEAVSVSCSRNSASEAMQKLLDRKFALHIDRFARVKTDAEVLALWKEHLERGEVAGALWAAMTHRSASPDTRYAVYGDVHMLSHQVGAGQAADVTRLGHLERECAALASVTQRDAARHAKDMAEKATRIRWLEAELGKVRKTADEARHWREEAEALASGSAMAEMARRLDASAEEAARLREAASRSEELLARVAALSEDNRRLAAERDELAGERDALESLWLAQPKPGCDEDCAHCPSHLQGRCVLCVGGRTALYAQYRQVAERLGMRLIHHDGGREEALSRLPDLLAASDAVICPTDCVGHLAYYQLKRHCKQAGKPCVLARSSSVAGFAAALNRLAQGQAEIGAPTR
jgi:hypothetical protein